MGSDFLIVSKVEFQREMQEIIAPRVVVILSDEANSGNISVSNANVAFAYGPAVANKDEFLQRLFRRRIEE